MKISYHDKLSEKSRAALAYGMRYTNRQIKEPVINKRNSLSCRRPSTQIPSKRSTEKSFEKENLHKQHIIPNNEYSSNDVSLFGTRNILLINDCSCVNPIKRPVTNMKNGRTSTLFKQSCQNSMMEFCKDIVSLKKPNEKKHVKIIKNSMNGKSTCEETLAEIMRKIVSRKRETTSLENRKQNMQKRSRKEHPLSVISLNLNYEKRQEKERNTISMLEYRKLRDIKEKRKYKRTKLLIHRHHKEFHRNTNDLLEYIEIGKATLNKSQNEENSGKCETIMKNELNKKSIMKLVENEINETGENIVLSQKYR